MATIKVYSVVDGNDIQRVLEQGADWISMDFNPQSPRYVSMVPTHAGIIPDRAHDNMPSESRHMPKKLGIFTDDMPQNIVTRVVNYHLDIVLMNGHETPTLLRNLRRTLDPDIRPGIVFIKRIDTGSAYNKEAGREYEDCADFLLFQAKSEPDQSGTLQGGIAIELHGIDGGTQAEGHFVLLPTGRQ